jgi:metal transporter CNNM
MILTGPISYPIAWLLDRICGRKDACSIFSNDQLEELIRYHDRSEKRGGQLGQDATRIAIGALRLESRTIGAEIMRVVDPVPENCEKDIEKAEVIVTSGLVVEWSLVKTVNIDDIIDRAFIKKVKSWSYSRIPVISKAEISAWVGNEKEMPIMPGELEKWEGTRIHGFLHIRVSLLSYYSYSTPIANINLEIC